MADSKMEVKLIDFEDDVDFSKYFPNESQSNGDDVTYHAIRITTEEIVDEKPVVKEEKRASSPTVEVDPDFLRKMRREQMRLIAGQRSSVPIDPLPSRSITDYNYYNGTEPLRPKLVPPQMPAPPPPKFNGNHHPDDRNVETPVSEDVIKPVVVLRKDYAESFLNLINKEPNDDGIVWTPIEPLELEDHQQRRTISDNVDRNSIIDNKDFTKEFLMGKMLESIEYEAVSNTSRLSKGNNRPSTVTSALLITNGHQENHLLQQNGQKEVEVKVKEVEAMQLVSARPCFVVDGTYLAKVAEPGSKKTTAQLSAEARIAKEIEEIRLREIELSRSRAVEPIIATEPEISFSRFTAVNHSPSSVMSFESVEQIDYTDLKSFAFSEELDETLPPPLPLSPPPSLPLSAPPPKLILPAPPLIQFATALPLSQPPPPPPTTLSLAKPAAYPELFTPVAAIVPEERPTEKIKVRPLVEDSDEEEPSQRYKFFKETAVEREIRLALQREEELRRDRQQMHQKHEPVDSKKVEEEIKIETTQLESLTVVSQPSISTVEAVSIAPKVKSEPPSRLILPSTINRGYIGSNTAQVGKFHNETSVNRVQSVIEIDEIYNGTSINRIQIEAPVNNIHNEVPVNRVEIEDVIIKKQQPEKLKFTPVVESVAGEKFSPSYNQLNTSFESENDFKVPSSAPPTSRSFTFPNTNGVKRPSFSGDRLPNLSGTLPNRNSTRGLMQKFFASHGKPMTTFVPKTTFPPVQPVYNINAKDNSIISTNGHHNDKVADNDTGSSNAKLQSSPKKPLSSVESKILGELREMQGRENELKKERSRLSIHSELSIEDDDGHVSNGMTASSTSVWGIFTMVGDRNGHVNT